MKQRAAFLFFAWIIQLVTLGPASPQILAAAEDADPWIVADNPDDAWLLSLKECVQETLENNLDIAVSRYDPLMTETRVPFEEAVFDPLLTGGASSAVFERRGLSQFVIGGFFSEDKIHDYNIGFLDPLSLGGSYEIKINANDDAQFDASGFVTSWQFIFRQPLLRNLGPNTNRTGIIVARNTLGISESQFRQRVMDSIAEAETAYWSLNFALMEFRTLGASLQQAKDFLEQNRIKVRVGTLAPIEITQAEAQVADREQDVIVAEFAIQSAEDTLRRIMGVSIGSSIWSRPIRPSEAPPLLEVTPDLEEAEEAARLNRPDLEQVRLDINSQEAGLAFRKNQKRWALDFEGSYGGQGFSQDDPLVGELGSYGDSFEDLLDRNQISWRLALNLTVPLRNRVAIANFTEARYALDQARYEQKRVAQLALVEVRNAVRAVVTRLRQVKAAQVNTRLQREKLEAEQKKYENGMSTSFEVLTFQTDLAQAETRLNRAVVGYNNSQVELERAQGTLLQSRGVVIPDPADDVTGAPGGSQSASLRHRWTKGRAQEEYGLRLADPVPAKITLPVGFVLGNGRVSRTGWEEDEVFGASAGGQ